MDDLSLTYLLEGKHFSVPERISRGIWPHPPLAMADLREHLVRRLKGNRWFPVQLDANRPADLDGPVTIERSEAEEWIAHFDDHYQHVEKRFKSAEEAAEFYFRWSLHLPGDLDGWTVK